MLRWRRLEISGGCLLLLAILYYLDQDGMMLWGLAFCGLHELGHLAAVYILGGQISYVRLSCVGAEIRLSARKPLGHARELLTALAGPAVNLLLAYAAARLRNPWGYCAAGINLALAWFNLLPAAQLDGGRIMLHLCSLLVGEPLAKRIVQMCSMIVSLLLVLTGGILWIYGRKNVTLLFTAGWLLFSLYAEGKISVRAQK